MKLYTKESDTPSTTGVMNIGVVGIIVAFWRDVSLKNPSQFTPLKTNTDTQNDVLEKVPPFKYGLFWYQFVKFLGCRLSIFGVEKIHIFLV